MIINFNDLSNTEIIKRRDNHLCITCGKDVSKLDFGERYAWRLDKKHVRAYKAISQKYPQNNSYYIVYFCSGCWSQVYSSVEHIDAKLNSL